MVKKFPNVERTTLYQKFPPKFSMAQYCIFVLLCGAHTLGTPPILFLFPWFNSSSSF
jgi:hypothetical protein